MMIIRTVILAMLLQSSSITSIIIISIVVIFVVAILIIVLVILSLIIRHSRSPTRRGGNRHTIVIARCKSHLHRTTVWRLA